MDQGRNTCATPLATLSRLTGHEVLSDIYHGASIKGVYNL
jgi:hypothetical protein